MSSKNFDLNNNLENNDEPSKKKHKLSQIEKSIIKLNYLSNLKIRKKYNCTKKTYEKCIISFLINNANCHLVSVFKEKMLLDFIDEFLRRKYSKQEGFERIPKFAVYYKNYLQFFCKPTFTDFAVNEIINDYGEKKAELYYKNNYQGGKSKENEDLGFEESNSDDESENIKFKGGDNGQIFDESIKDNIDNVTIMTTINNSKNNTINLNLNNEKIEVFSENKCDHSNDTTLHELMDIVKKGEKNMYKIKEKNEERLGDKNNEISDNNNLNSNNTENTNTNINNFNKSNKAHKSKKRKSDLNIVDYKHVLLNKGIVVHSQSKKKENNKIVKKKIDKNNLQLNLIKTNNKIINKLSFEKLQHILKKGGNTVKNKNTNSKYPLNNYINDIVNETKETTEKNKALNQIKKDSFNKKSSNNKLNNYSANLNTKTKSLSKEKEKELAERKNTKNNNNKTNNRFYSIKSSYGSINQFNKSNNLNFNTGQRTNKNYSRSRNNTGFLYKQQTHTNNIINNNIMFNLNNIYNTTSLHKMNKNIINNIHNNGYFGKTNAFKTLNFMQKTNYHQRYNNNLLQLHNDNKFHISNTSQDNKSSSLKILVTDFNNNNANIKPAIKLKKEKYLIKAKYANNRENNFNEINKNKNHRITKSYNNLNMNNIHLSNNGITSYNNLKNKYKKYSHSKINHQLKNIKQNQIKSNSSNKQKKSESNNKELMQFALSLLLDNNSAFSNVVENNNLNIHQNNNNINSNNILSRKNNLNTNKNTKTNSIKKSKVNYNYKNKYHNNNTNYNININNQININTNSGKDYLNTKLKNQELSNNHNNYSNNQKDIMYNNFFNANSNTHASGGGNSHNNNSENINLNKKMKGKNILLGLKKGYLNNNKNNENIIKSYHTKSVSSLTDIISHNKKLSSLNKNVSKSKSKEHKKI